MSHLLTIHAVAERLGVSDRQVRRFLTATADPLPAVHLGGRCRRIDPTDLEGWLARRRDVVLTPEPGLFAGFSDSARAALEGLFCTHTAPAAEKTQQARALTA